MTPFQTILCAVDQSEYSRSTLQRAVDLGRALHATVAVMTVRTNGEENEWQGSLDPDVDFNEALAQRHAGAEEGAVAKLITFVREAAGVTPARAIAIRGRVVPAILRVAQDVAADLIVVGMHGPPGGFARLILSPATERVVDKAICPVLAVPRRPPTKAADFALRTIVCGVDRSASSRRALEYACVIAQHVDARVIVVHAIEDIGDEDPTITMGHFNTPECRREIAPAVHASYEQVMPTDMGLKHDVELQTPVGTAHAALVRVANETGADLIVIGATGWHGLFGKTVRHTLRDAGCDVMTVPASRQHQRP
jgi:nucleotide-binding universal stress UspA family protein